jgi:biotin transporter BioY
MMRIIFWILVASGLAAFFFGASRQRIMSVEENTLLWGSIVCGVMAIFAFGSGYMVYYCWKKRVAALVGKYGASRIYARDSEPSRYWLIVLFYFLVFLLVSTLTCSLGFMLLPILEKQLSH